MAEQLLRARLNSAQRPLSQRIYVTSAGLHTIDGVPMDKLAAQECARLGGDPAKAVSVVATSKVLRNADLILGMTREHQQEIVSRFPTLLKRTFTLRQMGRILLSFELEHRLPDFSTASIGSIIDRAARMRPTLGPAVAEDDDVPDPINQSPAVHKYVADLIEKNISILWGAFEYLEATPR